MRNYRLAKFIFVTLTIFLIVGSTAVTSSLAADPVTVRAVLFYSPTCPACHQVINEVLPPLIEQYPEQLQIIGVDITQQAGNELYQSLVSEYKIPDERIGVPTLIVGEIVLVGGREIPDELPSLISRGIQAGGVDWPYIPGLDQALAQVDLDQNVSNPEESQSASSSDLRMVDRFMLDPVANSIAVIVLAGMLISVVAVGHRFLTGKKDGRVWPNWVLPALSIIGLGIAAYLSYVEFSHTDAICGPVGKCNSVQESQYAYLFGVIPVGVMGAFGYIAILTAWLVYQFGPESLRKISILAVWGFAWFGILFSIYLTFLEPFVIGATCAWCIASAIIMTLILWASTGPALKSMEFYDYEDEFLEEDELDDVEVNDQLSEELTNLETDSHISENELE